MGDLTSCVVKGDFIKYYSYKFMWFVYVAILLLVVDYYSVVKPEYLSNKVSEKQISLFLRGVSVLLLFAFILINIYTINGVLSIT